MRLLDGGEELVSVVLDHFYLEVSHALEGVPFGGDNIVLSAFVVGEHLPDIVAGYVERSSEHSEDRDSRSLRPLSPSPLRRGPSILLVPASLLGGVRPLPLLLLLFYLPLILPPLMLSPVPDLHSLFEVVVEGFREFGVEYQLGVLKGKVDGLDLLDEVDGIAVVFESYTCIDSIAELRLGYPSLLIIVTLLMGAQLYILSRS